MKILTAKNICKKYGKKTVLNDISFSAAPGSIIAIGGANGCGKSTFLSILSGTSRPDSGSVFFNEAKEAAKSGDFTKMTGYVPQQNALFYTLSVYDNLRFWYCNTKRSLKADMENGLPARFGLNEYKDMPVFKLSGGMQKRLAIACCLASAPPILILDEPTASLDIICKNDIQSYLIDYKKNGGTVIITSHEDSDIVNADVMYIIENGSLILLDHPLSGTALADRLKNGGSI